MTVPYDNFSSVLQEIRETYPANALLQISFNNFTINVWTNNNNLHRALSAYFSEFVNNSPTPHVDTSITVHESPTLALPYTFQLSIPTPAHKKIKREWIDIDGGRIVRHRITGVTYLIGNTQYAMAGSCLANKNQVVQFINSRFINHKLNSGFLLGHGAGVAANGRGMIISGNSGAGKSTLALHMLTSGANFVSNDRVLINNRGADPFFGTLQHPRINPGTALHNPNLEKIIPQEDKTTFKRLTPEKLWQTENKYDAIIPECFGENRFTPYAPLNAVTILDWHRGNEPMQCSVQTAQESSAQLAYLMKKNDVLHIPKRTGYTPPSIRDYISALDNTPVFVIRGGVDFATAADKLLSYLSSGITDA